MNHYFNSLCIDILLLFFNRNEILGKDIPYSFGDNNIKPVEEALSFLINTGFIKKISENGTYERPFLWYPDQKYRITFFGLWIIKTNQMTLILPSPYVK